MPSLREYDAECHLSEGDVTVDSTAAPSIIQVRIKAPYRKGVSVYLGRTDNDLCPVAAVTAYLAVRGRGPGPFFRLEGGAPLSRELLVKRCCKQGALMSRSIQATASKSEQQQRQQQQVWKIP